MVSPQRCQGGLVKSVRWKCQQVPVAITEYFPYPLCALVSLNGIAVGSRTSKICRLFRYSRASCLWKPEMDVIIVNSGWCVNFAQIFERQSLEEFSEYVSSRVAYVQSCSSNGNLSTMHGTNACLLPMILPYCNFTFAIFLVIFNKSAFDVSAFSGGEKI